MCFACEPVKVLLFLKRELDYNSKYGEIVISQSIF